MKILFNTFRFPTVKVKITNDTDTDNDSYNRFMEYWENNYKIKKHFHLVMDLASLTIPNMGLCLDFIYRQREMKKSEIQYLDYSVVVVNNTLIQTILNGIWRICPPLNTVYLVTEMSVGIALLKCINNPIYSAEYINTYIEMYNITKI
tara:strand:+ start:451 stop:894 length:444 start_codon:yes stop_codon:yes gene_type:complete